MDHSMDHTPSRPRLRFWAGLVLALGIGFAVVWQWGGAKLWRGLQWTGEVDLVETAVDVSHRMEDFEELLAAFRSNDGRLASEQELDRERLLREHGVLGCRRHTLGTYEFVIGQGLGSLVGANTVLVVYAPGVPPAYGPEPVQVPGQERWWVVLDPH